MISCSLKVREVIGILGVNKLLCIVLVCFMYDAVVAGLIETSSNLIEGHNPHSKTDL